MSMPVPDAVDGPERDERDVARAPSAGVRLIVRQPVPSPAPRWPGARPRTGASAPDAPGTTRRRRAASELPASDRRAGAFASTAPVVTREVRRVRLTVACGLALLFASALAFLVTGIQDRSLPRADLRSFEERLTGYDHDVRAQLARLGPPGSVSRARLRTREALAATEALARQLRDFNGSAAVRLRTATRAQLRYLDAVGSTLINPRSPLRAQLSARAIAARDALAALDPAAPPARPR